MKVAISGAGVAGPTLAWWLARSGHDVTLIEAAPRLRTGGYIIDFWGVGYTVAERMGLLPAIHDAGYAVQEVRFVDGRGRRAGGFGAKVFRRTVGDRFVSLPRGDLAAAIYRSVEDRVATRFGASISAIVEQADGLRLRLDDGSEHACDLLVGADGLHSNVRALRFGPQDRFERSLGYYVAAFDAQGYRPRDELTYMSYGLPGRQISRFSQRGERTMFLFVFTADHLPGREPIDLEDRKAVLREVFRGAEWEWPAIREAMDSAGELYFDRVSKIVADRWSSGRVALAGDAAACVSLLAGEGTGLAMAEAYVLAGELARAGGDHALAFRRYEDRLQPFVEGKQTSARQFAGSFAPRTRMGVWLRNQATRLMGIPKVADLLIGSSLRDDLELPDYGL
jgi:2-polyprenyl-6-methoxyphenol hydroxylase-like FAD-dependent oxidoreductase